MGPTWSVVNTDTWLPETEESLGTKEKFWVSDPGGSHWLFKYARVRDNNVRGEDWAEWAAHHVGVLLGVPTVDIRPAVCGDRRGIVSRSHVPDDFRLEHGNELLARGQPADAAAKRESVGYTPNAVFACLHGALPPRGWPQLEAFSAFDVWAGYLVLDALVAGRDRHHENWATIAGGDRRWLYPSYDHGNALGFQESDEKRLACISDEDRLRTWARKGRSHHFAGRPSLVAVAHESLGLASPDARRHWLAALDRMDMAAVEKIMHAVPDSIMSEPARTFCLRLMELNRRRVLDGD